MFTISFFAITAFALAQSTTYQQGYTKSNGTYKGTTKQLPTTQTQTITQHKETQGNTNSYTGESGSKPRDYSSESSNYSAGKNVQTSSRGGQYYTKIVMEIKLMFQKSKSIFLQLF